MKNKVKIFSILLVLFVVLGITGCDKPTSTPQNKVSVVGSWRIGEAYSFYDKLIFNDSGMVKYYLDGELEGTVAYTQSGTKVTFYGDLAGISGTVSETTLTLSFEGFYIDFYRM